MYAVPVADQVGRDRELAVAGMAEVMVRLLNQHADEAAGDGSRQ